MSDAAQSGADFKKELRAGSPKMGLFVNSHSPTVAEQLAHSGYDWLLVDTQHGPMNYEKLSAMLSGVSSGGAKSMVRVGGYDLVLYQTGGRDRRGDIERGEAGGRTGRHSHGH